jgi:hypothetical protein
VVLEGCEAVVTVTHASIEVLRHSGLKKVRCAYGVLCGRIQDNIFFYNNSLSVVHRALAERLYFVKSTDGFVPCPQPTISFSSLAYFTRDAVRKLPSLPPVWSSERFAASYTGSKKKRYEQAIISLARRGVRRSYGFWKTFIKAELYNATNKENPCPRLIQPRSPEYNVLIGRYLRPAEKLIYKAIDRVFKHHVVLKCDNPWQRASAILRYWSEFDEPCFVGLDASRFDQHVSAEALEYEHSLYNSIFSCPELAEYLTWQINNKGYANVPDGTIKYSVRGVRGSGDMNTALGNVYLMCSITHHFLRDLPCKWRFINDGDDCGIFLEKRDLHLLEGLPAHHLSYGFEMEVEEAVFQIEHVEFCQSKPINLGGGWMMVRNIRKALLNDWVNLNAPNYATLEELFVATGRCGLALYADVPILSEMYEAMTRFSGRSHVVDRILSECFSGIGRTWRMFASQNRKFPVDEMTARVSIYKAFSILPDTQICLEKEFRALNPQALSSKQIHSFYSDPHSRIQYYLNG